MWAGESLPSTRLVRPRTTREPGQVPHLPGGQSVGVGGDPPPRGSQDEGERHRERARGAVETGQRVVALGLPDPRPGARRTGPGGAQRRPRRGGVVARTPRRAAASGCRTSGTARGRTARRGRRRWPSTRPCRGPAPPGSGRSAADQRPARAARPPVSPLARGRPSCREWPVRAAIDGGGALRDVAAPGPPEPGATVAVRPATAPGPPDRAVPAARREAEADRGGQQHGDGRGRGTPGGPHPVIVGPPAPPRSSAHVTQDAGVPECRGEPPGSTRRAVGAGYSPVAPSIDSRSRSAWPLWRAYSSIR